MGCNARPHVPLHRIAGHTLTRAPWFLFPGKDSRHPLSRTASCYIMSQCECNGAWQGMDGRRCGAAWVGAEAPRRATLMSLRQPAA